jgi:hypothetical protein
MPEARAFCLRNCFLICTHSPDGQSIPARSRLTEGRRKQSEEMERDLAGSLNTRAVCSVHSLRSQFRIASMGQSLVVNLHGPIGSHAAKQSGANGPAHHLTAGHRGLGKVMFRSSEDWCE